MSAPPFSTPFPIIRTGTTPIPEINIQYNSSEGIWPCVSSITYLGGPAGTSSSVVVHQATLADRGQDEIARVNANRIGYTGDIPDGEHRFAISITDLFGRTTREQFSIVITSSTSPGTGILEVTAEDTAGTPISNVLIEYADSGNPSVAIQVGRTNGAGQINFVNITPNIVYTIRASAAGYRVVRFDRQERFMCVAGISQVRKVILERNPGPSPSEGIFEIKVLDPSGTIIQDAQVALRDSSGINTPTTVTTNRSGDEVHITNRIQAGNYTILAGRNGYNSGRKTTTLNATIKDETITLTPQTPGPTPPIVPPGPTPPVNPIENTTETGIIEGTVEDANNEPIAGALVRLVDSGNSSRIVRGTRRNNDLVTIAVLDNDGRARYRFQDVPFIPVRIVVVVDGREYPSENSIQLTENRRVRSGIRTIVPIINESNEPGVNLIRGRVTELQLRPGQAVVGELVNEDTGDVVQRTNVVLYEGVPTFTFRGVPRNTRVRVRIVTDDEQYEGDVLALTDGQPAITNTIARIATKRLSSGTPKVTSGREPPKQLNPGTPEGTLAKTSLTAIDNTDEIPIRGIKAIYRPRINGQPEQDYPSNITVSDGKTDVFGPPYTSGELIIFDESGRYETENINLAISENSELTVRLKPRNRIGPGQQNKQLGSGELPKIGPGSSPKLLNPGTPELDITSTTLKVVDENGNPVKGIKAYYRARIKGEPTKEYASGITSSDGTAAIVGPPYTSGELVIFDDNGNYESQRRSLSISETNPVPIILKSIPKTQKRIGPGETLKRIGPGEPQSDEPHSYEDGTIAGTIENLEVFSNEREGIVCQLINSQTDRMVKQTELPLRNGKPTFVFHNVSRNVPLRIRIITNKTTTDSLDLLMLTDEQPIIANKVVRMGSTTPLNGRSDDNESITTIKPAQPISITPTGRKIADQNGAQAAEIKIRKNNIIAAEFNVQVGTSEPNAITPTFDFIIDKTKGFFKFPVNKEIGINSQELVKLANLKLEYRVANGPINHVVRLDPPSTWINSFTQKGGLFEGEKIVGLKITATLDSHPENKAILIINF